MRTIPEAAESILNILNEVERTEECNGDTLCDINELVGEILAINSTITPCYLGSPCEYQREDVSINYGWIFCSERLPIVETEVQILAKRKWRDGTFKYIITNALYEDGTVLENDSVWRWEDIEGEWNEEEDCYIIPKGWWESKHYNPDGELNYAVDDEVIAWQPLPEIPEELVS